MRGLDVGSEHFQTKFRRVIDAENEWSLQFYHIRQRKADEAYQDWIRQSRDRAFVENRYDER